MSASESNHRQDRIELPHRPVPVRQETQTAREREDGTIEPEGPGRIQESEVIAPRRRWKAKFERKEEWKQAIDQAVRGMHALSPPFTAAAEALRTEIESRAVPWGESKSKWAALWLIVHERSSSFRDLGRGLAEALFGDDSAFVIVDCAIPQNSGERLFGYRGCLEGGTISNQLKIRPESVVILKNFEVADKETLTIIHNLARSNSGFSRVVARGAEVCELRPYDALFVIATSRSFTDIVAGSQQSEGKACDALIASIQERPDDLDLQRDFYGILQGKMLVWN